MKKTKNITLLIGKIFLVFLMLFSQMYTPMVVIAEELQTGNDESETLKEENTEETNDENNVVETPKEENTLEEETKKEETTTNSEETTNNIEEPNKKETTPETNQPSEPENTKNETPPNNNEEPSNNVEQEPSSEETPPTGQETTPEETSETELKYKVTINDVEVEEYTLEANNKTITIHQEYNGEDGTYKFGNNIETIDFTNKLYGKYTFYYNVLSNEDEELDSKTITINYNGNNSEILEKYNKTAIYIMDGEIGIDGTTKKLTVEEVLNNFDTESLQNEYNAHLEIRDKDGNILENTKEIDKEDKLVLTNDEVEEEFTIFIIGDQTNDGIVNLEDAAKIIEDMLSFDGEEGEFAVSILDATNSKYTTGIWNQFPEVKDTLTNSLVNKTQIYEGEEVEVKYYINGFENDKLSGIQGIINYDKNILELTNIQIDSKYGNINENGKFAYLFDNYQSNDILMTITFKGIAPGEANISIDNILAAYLGMPLNLDESVSTNITVIELPKGGDVAPTNEESNNNTTTATPTTTTTTDYSTVYTDYQSLRPISLSSNNLIRSLEIKGYKIDFDPNKLKYAIKVKNNVKSLDLKIILDDENATYEVKGNENFKVGENTVEIIVTAEDGSTRTYTIDVTRAKAKKEATEEETEKSSKGIIIALIVLVIIGLIYVIFKDDSENEE